MSSWTLDEKRFREEVFGALNKNWDPRNNLFRCYQLPPDISDTAVIEAALKGVRGFVNRNAISGVQSGPAKVMLGVHKEAAVILQDPVQRAQHKAQVLARHGELERTLKAELSGVTAVPTATATLLAVKRERDFSRGEVIAALTAIGCVIREPVPLPARKNPTGEWVEVKHAVSLLGFPTLRAYLRARYGTTVDVREQQLSERRTAMQRSVSGEALTQEMKVIATVQKWRAAGELTDLLRADLLRDLEAEAALGSDHLNEAIASQDVTAYLKEVGLPGADDLSYALISAQRFPGERASSWQSSYREARARRDLRGALDILAAQQPLDREFSKERDALKVEIEAVEGMLARARSIERTDVEAAAELYVQALQRCRDPEVDAALKRCRPAAPATVTATANGGNVRVEWKPSTARVGNINYLVVRHVEGGGRGDGAVVGDGISELSVTDMSPPGGVVVRYAVWTLRNDEQSAASRLSGDVSVLHPVDDLELLPGEKWIEVRWQLPKGASGARVTRGNVGAAPVVTHSAGASYRDSDVQTGITYEYTVESEYRLTGGSVGYGAPISNQIRRQDPPQPVRDVTVTVDGDSMVLTWTSPPRGDVHLRDLGSAPQVSLGQVISAAGVERIGQRLRSVEPQRDGRLRVPLPTDGRRHWMLPLTVVDGFAVVGSPVEYDSRLPSVSDLRVVRLGPQLQVTWRWPERVSEVLILSRTKVPPVGPDDPDATRRHLTHAAYQRSGCHLPATGGEQWVGVCVNAYVDSVPMHGPMVSAGATSPSEVGYEVQKISGFRNKRRRRLVVAARAGGTLGGVRVVARARIPPLNPEDGIELARFAAPVGETSMSAEFDVTAAGRPLFIRAFPTDENGPVLVPTNPAQLRID